MSLNARAATGASGYKRPRTEPKMIANKIKRGEVVAKLKSLQKKEKRKRRDDRKLLEQQLGAAAPPKQTPRTIDNTRELDETVVLPGDEEVLGDEADDEFSEYFSGAKEPKIMITTRTSPSGKIFRTLAELMAVIPNSYYYRRGQYRLKKICEWAAKREFTHLIIVNEKAKVPNGMVVCHLPFGPSMSFKMTGSMLSTDVPGHGSMSTHLPELFLNGFGTRLGRRVGRMLASMFPKKAEFTGRRVCTFHNQRDFIFFRQHRYIFSEEGKKVRLQELGPRFTLKLKWVLASAFDTKEGEYEWFHKRHAMETSRRKFML